MWIVWLLLAPLAHAQDSVSNAVCLSDGQTLSGERVDVHDAHRTVRIGADEIRVPTASLGTNCSELRISERIVPSDLRTVTLTDGQTLHGVVLETPGTLTLELLDEQRIHLPMTAVSKQGSLVVDDPALEALKRERNQGRTRKTLGIVGAVALGVVGAAATGAAVYGVTEAIPEPVR